MGYFLAAYIIGVAAVTAYDPSLAMWGIIGALIIGSLLGIVAFAESWVDVLLIPVGLFLCACSTI